jgi:hypothetical protein
MRNQTDIGEDFRKTFGTDHGRRVLHYLMRSCHLFEPSFVPVEKNIPTELGLWRDGRRSVVADILRHMSVYTMEPDQYNDLGELSPYDAGGMHTNMPSAEVADWRLETQL